MRIALATDWFPPRVGGIENQLGQLAEGLARRGHDVEVLTSTPGARAGLGYRVKHVKAARLPWMDVVMSPRVLPELRALLADGYDVVHAHVSVVSPVAYAAAAAAAAVGVPAVVTFHSVLRAKRLLLAGANALLGIGGGGVVWTAVSSLVASQAARALDSEVEVLPNGIDLDSWSGAGSGSRQRKHVTFVSTMRLNRKKRPLAVLRAFEHAVRRSAAHMRLVIVGVGPFERRLRRRIERSSHASLAAEMRGVLRQEELRDLYAASDCFILGSRRESFGIAALEARAVGLPVIGMRESGLTEFIVHESNGLLADDDRHLASLMARFADDGPLRERLALPTDLTRFDWQEVLARHEATYRHAMRPERAGRAVAAATA